MGMKTAYSSKARIEDVITDLREQSQDFRANLVLYFASVKFDPDMLSGQMQQLFEGIPVFGCSTAGEIVSGKMLKGSVVVMLFDAETIEDVTVEVVEHIATENRIPEVFKRFDAYYHTPMSAMDFQQYVGIILVDGLSRAEERVMDKIGDLTNIQFIGGSAGDDLQFAKTYVYANGKTYTDAAVLVLIKPKVGFEIVKTQSFCPLAKTLVATKVDEPQRRVLEFNNKPAVEAYAEALGTTVAEASNFFMNHPVGLMVGDEPYVRSPQQIQGKEMVFYCNIKAGMELKVLESTDIVADTQQAIDEIVKKLDNVAGIINFHCILRTLELEQEGRTEEYGKIFTDIPTIGFSTYGEEYIGHINQTSTMLVFK